MIDRKSITLIGAEKCIFTGEENGVVLYKKEYRGLEEHVGLLPHDADLATGSSCLFVDTGAYYEYLRYNDTWYKVGG